MTYATVMVGMALDQSNEARLEVAGHLADRFVSTVIGIAAAEFSPPLYFTDGEQAGKVIDQGRAAVKNRLADLEAEFRAAMQNRATEAASYNGLVQSFPEIVRLAREGPKPREKQAEFSDIEE